MPKMPFEFNNDEWVIINSIDLISTCAYIWNDFNHFANAFKVHFTLTQPEPDIFYWTYMS